jgi:alanine dehydrogenase
MEVLVIGHREVRDLLPVADCIEVMAGALTTLAKGEAVLPLRSVLAQPDRRGFLGLMPAYLGQPQAVGVKVVTVFPGNLATTYESHQGAILVFETGNGRLLAMVDAGTVTEIRTAAVSAVATRLLARPDAHTLAILGSGTQARVHLEAMRAVRDIREVRVWSRTPEHARAFAERHGIHMAATAREAVAGADIVCTVTGAQAPILEGAWLAPGAHINAVGASVPPFRELDSAAVAAARLFVDRRESALNEADDIRIPIREGAIAERHIAGELGELLRERVPGRTSPDQITLFKSLGLAVEDLAAAHHVYAQAAARGAGARLDFVGERHA